MPKKCIGFEKIEGFLSTSLSNAIVGILFGKREHNHL